MSKTTNHAKAIAKIEKIKSWVPRFDYDMHYRSQLEEIKSEVVAWAEECVAEFESTGNYNYIIVLIQCDISMLIGKSSTAQEIDKKVNAIRKSRKQRDAEYYSPLWIRCIASRQPGSFAKIAAERTEVRSLLPVDRGMCQSLESLVMIGITGQLARWASSAMAPRQKWQVG